MKKLINGKEVKLDSGFLSECIKGKLTNQVLPNNINDISENIPKQIITIINKYKKIYDNLNFLIKYNQSELKYCLLGELLNVDYLVKDAILKIKIDNKQMLAFKEEYWGIEKLDKSGKTWKDFTDEGYYKYFNSYLSDPNNFIKNNFNELYEAYNKRENLIERDLESLLHFIDVKSIKLKENEFLDTATFTKFKLIPYYVGDNETNGKESIYIDLDSKETKKSKTYKDVYDFKLYKQNLIEGRTGTKDFTELKDISDKRFDKIIETLLKLNIRETKGFIIGDEIYFQIGKDIYRYTSKSVEKIIQNGEIYGIYNNKLLIKNSKKDKNIEHNLIYILNDDYLDLASVNFNIII